MKFKNNWKVIFEAIYAIDRLCIYIVDTMQWPMTIYIYWAINKVVLGLFSKNCEHRFLSHKIA